MKSTRLLRPLLIVHGVVTLAAAVVLVVLPAAIPAAVGIPVGVNAYLLCYFLAAAELAIGMLSLGAVRLADVTALRLIVDVFIVFHLATAGLEVMYVVLTSENPVLLANIAVRVFVAAVFFAARRSTRVTLQPS